MRVAVVLTARPSWAKLSPVCHALKARPNVQLQLVVCASALLERYGRVESVVEREGFSITERVYSVLEGATPESTAIEVGTLQSALSRTYARLKPDVVVVCADRREILATAAAARMQEIRLLHLQGGEKTGSVDDAVRDAVTHLSSVHCVCTTQARYRVYSLTGDWANIHQTGCPSLDVARTAIEGPPVTLDELSGVGCPVDLAERFVVVLQHPVADHHQQAGAELDRTIVACLAAGLPTVVFWPGQDAGAEAMSKRIRHWDHKVRAVRNLPPERFLKLLTQAACLVGNSSAGIRECSFLGVPVVNVGDRQTGRERGPNVRDVTDPKDIYPALAQQISHGPFNGSSLYGDGFAAERIAEVMTR